MNIKFYVEPPYYVLADEDGREIARGAGAEEFTEALNKAMKADADFVSWMLICLEESLANISHSVQNSQNIVKRMMDARKENVEE